MESLQIIYLVTAVLSSVSAVLAWVAKIRWSDEYSKAKEETIRSKEAQLLLVERELETYKNLTPMKIEEYYNSSVKLLGEYNDSLQNKLDSAQIELVQQSSLLHDYSEDGIKLQEELVKHKDQIHELELTIKSLEDEKSKNSKLLTDITILSDTVDEFNIKHLKSLKFLELTKNYLITSGTVSSELNKESILEKEILKRLQRDTGE